MVVHLSAQFLFLVRTIIFPPLQYVLLQRATVCCQQIIFQGLYIWKLSTAPEDAGKIVAVYLCIANHKKQFLDLPSIKILLIIIRISSAFALFSLFIPRCVSNPAISSISKIFTVPSPPSSSMENMV